MGLKVFTFFKNNNKITLKLKKCNFFEMGLGLMFKKEKTAEALLFEFKKPTKMALTSYFVFFPFIAVWLDKRNNVMEMKKINPFTAHIPSKMPFTRLVEIPINKKYEKIIQNIGF